MRYDDPFDLEFSEDPGLAAQQGQPADSSSRPGNGAADTFAPVDDEPAAASNNGALANGARADAAPEPPLWSTADDHVLHLPPQSLERVVVTLPWLRGSWRPGTRPVPPPPRRRAIQTIGQVVRGAPRVGTRRTRMGPVPLFRSRAANRNFRILARPRAGLRHEILSIEQEFDERETPPPPAKVQLVSAKPGLGEMVDYLDASVLARGRVRVPIRSIDFLIKQDPPKRPTWWKRLWKDAATIVPTVTVTIELAQAGVSLVPLGNYVNNFIFKDALEEYTKRLHARTAPCDTDFVPVIGAAFLIGAKPAIEQDLGITGQLDALLKAAKIRLPLPAKDAQRLFWIVYATFPDSIRSYVIPRGRVLLDAFAFNKSQLTDSHKGKINAIARHCVAATKFVGTPPKIVLAGHTDARGTEQYNEGLGGRRAAAVEEALRKSIDVLAPGLSRRMTITRQSLGEKKPLVQARSEAEHARNRRVEALLQVPLGRCTRVSLRAVVERGLKQLPRLASRDQAQRIGCVLRKVLRKGSDDRWVYPQLVLTVENQTLMPGKYPFALLRDYLSALGANASDAALLKSLESLDEQIIAAIDTVNKRIQLLSGAASQTIPLVPTMKAMDGLRSWLNDRVKDEASIYSCYRKV